MADFQNSQQTTTRAVDVVAILRADTMAQVFEKARPLQATVFEVADPMEHPLEDGSETTDHIVFQPTEIDMPLMLTDEIVEVFEEIRQLYREGVLLVVQTRAATYPSMLLVQIPHDENPEALTSTTVAVRFREAKFVTATYGGLAPQQVKEKPKASTVKRGSQQTTVTPAPQAAKAGEQVKGSTLHRLANRG